MSQALATVTPAPSHGQRVAVTLGDPAGVGPEVVLSALADPEFRTRRVFDLYADPGDLCDAFAAVTNVRPNLAEVAEAILAGHPEAPARVVAVTGRAKPGQLQLGCFDPARGATAVTALRCAIDDAMAGRVCALVTGPVNKAMFAFDPRFAGQSEFLAHHTGTRHWAMMLAGQRLRVVLVTTHLPLAAVSQGLNADLIVDRGRVALTFLRDRMGLARPRLGVAALNPHCGDGGLFGHEEATVIAPAVMRLREEGHDVSGPLPADTLFVRAADGQFDCVLAMYHDQGLIPLKLLDFGRAVNITLGLPFVRTSPDHGVAYDIAGRGLANPGAMKAALRMAVDLGLRPC